MAQLILQFGLLAVAPPQQLYRVQGQILSTCQTSLVYSM